METFRGLLTCNERLQGLFIRTDFLTSMSEDNILRFFQTLGKIPFLEELIIQSSSRFHVEEIPPLGLLCLRHATQLHTLGLEDMQVTAAHTVFLASLDMALRHHPSLVSVSLRNFFANDGANTEANVLDPVLKALGTIPNLRQLEFSGCGSHALTGHDIRLISTHSLGTIVGKPTLQHLELSFLDMEDDHFATIAECLKDRNSLLESLYLDYHKLGRDGFRCMMKALESNRGVKTLSLRSLRDIGAEGFQHAMNTLQVNYGIEALSITASPSQQAQIDLFVRMNGAGRARLREPSVSLSEWVDVIAKSSEDVDVVRHLLQEIPGLCHAAVSAAVATVVVVPPEKNRLPQQPNSPTTAAA